MVPAVEGRNRTEICVLHALFGCDIECALTEINTFLNKHQGEVIVLDFQKVYGFQLTNDHFLTRLIIQLYEDKLCPRKHSSPQPPSLEFMHEKGYQVIAVNNVGAEHSDLFWPRNSFPNHWYNTKSATHLLGCLNQGLEDRDLDSFHVSQAILTPRPSTVVTHPFCSLESCLARKANAMVEQEWLPHVRKEGGEVNIVITDFVQEGNIVEEVIRLNYDRRRPAVLDDRSKKKLNARGKTEKERRASKHKRMVHGGGEVAGVAKA